MQSIEGSAMSASRGSAQNINFILRILAVIAVMHNWDAMSLRICFCLLLVPCRNCNDDDFGVRSRWHYQRCRAEGECYSYIAQVAREFMTNPMFAAPKIPKRSAPSFFGTGFRPAYHSPNSIRYVKKSMNAIVSNVSCLPLEGANVVGYSWRWGS